MGRIGNLGKNMNTAECIKTRRSIRNFCSVLLPPPITDRILEAAIWAPSGKNGQPWKFKVIHDQEVIKQLASVSKHKQWLATAPCLIFLFLDKNKSYNYIKDVQSCGACMQNMLLCAHSLDIGSCWVGEILEHERQVYSMLAINDDRFELMGMAAFGYYSDLVLDTRRKSLDTFLL